MPDDSLHRIESEVQAAQVRAAFEASAEAWNRGDIDAYLATYLDAARTRWISGGAVIQGRDAIAAAVKARYPSPARMGTLHLTRLEIDVYSATDALVYGELDHVLGDRTTRLVCTVAMHWDGIAWRMVTDHTSALG